RRASGHGRRPASGWRVPHCPRAECGRPRPPQWPGPRRASAPCRLSRRHACGFRQRRHRGLGALHPRAPTGADTMSPRDRHALGLGLGIVLAAVVLLRLLPALTRQVIELRGRAVLAERLVQETEAAIAALPALEDSARSLTRAVVALAPRLLAGPAEPAALSDLSGQVTTMATRHDARVLRVGRMADSTAAGRLRRLSATVILETDFRGLAACLAALARGEATLVAEAVSVSAADPLALEGTTELLTVELRIRCWYFIVT